MITSEVYRVLKLDKDLSELIIQYKAIQYRWSYSLNLNVMKFRGILGCGEIKQKPHMMYNWNIAGIVCE